MVIALLLAAMQDPELVRGTLGRATRSAIEVHTADGRDIVCATGPDTHREAPPGPWQPGDQLEGWAAGAQPDCRWLSLKLVDRRKSAVRPRIGIDLNPLDSLLQRGNMMFAAVVLNVDGDVVNVRARNGTRYKMLLRPDTHYLLDGIAASREEIPMNRTIYIRAGTNFDGDIEVFRLAWGRILRPD